MPQADNPLVPSDGSLVFSDGGVLTHTVQYEDGNFSFGDVMHNQKEVQEFLSRGRFYAARETDDVTPEWSFDCHLIGTTDAVQATILDIVRRRGTWVAAVGTLPASAGGLAASGARGVYTVQLAWIGERTAFGATADSSLVLKYSRVRASFSEGIPGKLSLSGKSFPYSTDGITWT